METTSPESTTPPDEDYQSPFDTFTPLSEGAKLPQQAYVPNEKELKAKVDAVPFQIYDEFKTPGFEGGPDGLTPIDLAHKAKTDPTALESLDAVLEGNTLGDAAQQAGRILSGLFTEDDPNFKVTAEQLAEFPTQYQDFLKDAPNEAAFTERRADVLQRLEAQKIIEESGWGWKAANIGLEVAPYIAFAILVDKGFSAAAIASRLNMASRLTRMGVYGASAGTLDQSVYELNKQAGNEPNWALTVGLGIVLGGALGAFTHAPTGARKALGEVSEDVLRAEAHPTAVARELEEKGIGAESNAVAREVEQPRDLEAEHQVYGQRLDDTIDPETTVKVRRTAPKEKLDEARTKFQEDTRVLAEDIGLTSARARMSEKIATKLREIWERQGHRTEASETYYVPNVPNALEKIQKGLLRLEKNPFDAVTIAQALKGVKAGGAGAAQVMRVVVPQGSKILNPSALKMTAGEGSILAHGSLKASGKGGKSVKKTKLKDKSGVEYTTKDGKTIDVEMQNFKLEQPNVKKSTGEEKVMSGKDVDTGRPFNPDDLEGIGSGRAGSVGAAGVRESVHESKTGLNRVTERTMDIINANLHKASDEVDGWLPWLTSRYSKWLTLGGRLRFGDNQLASYVQPYLMHMGRDGTFAELDKGVVAPRALDEMRDELNHAMDARIMRSRTANYELFAKEVFENSGGVPNRFKAWYEKNKIEFEERFEEAAYHAMNGKTDGMSAYAGVKNYAKDVQRVFDEYLDILADPAKAFGKPPGSLRPVAQMDQVKAALKAEGLPYKPRVYMVDKIQAAMTKHGNDVFTDWLEGAIWSKVADQAVEVIDETTGAVVKVVKVKRAKIRQLAKKMNDVIIRSRGGFEETIQGINGGMDIEAFIRIAKEGNYAIDDELAEFLRAWTRPAPETTSKAGARTRSRVLLDEQFKLSRLDKYGNKSIGIDQFVDTNLTRITRGYNNSMSGWAAAANTTIRDADGKLLYDGFTNTAEIDKFIDDVAVKGFADKLDLKESEVIKNNLRYFFDNMTGMHRPSNVFNKNAEMASRWLMMYATFSRMGKAGLNQIIEFGNAVADGGINVITHVPQVKRMFGELEAMRKAGDAKGLKLFIDYLEHERGIGTHMDRSKTAGRNAGNFLFGGDFTDDLSTRAMKQGQKAVRGLLIGSGMLPMTAEMQKMAYHMMASKLVRQARKYKSFDQLPPRFKRQYRAMGLDDEIADRAIRMMNDNDMFQMSSNTMLGRLDFINPSNPNFDGQVMDQLAAGLRRRATRTIQENKIGAMHPAMDTLPGRMLLQFKSFTAGSITQQWIQRTRQVSGSLKQMKKGVVEGDSALMADAMASLGEPTAAFVYQGALALLTYRAYLELNALGMSDAERNKYMGLMWEKEGVLRNAMIARSGPTGWLPTIHNATIGAALGSEFYIGDVRSSGLSNTIQPASLNIMYQNLQAFSKIFDPLKGKEYSDKDAKRLANTVTNFWAFEAMVQLAAQKYLPDDRKGR